MTLDEARANIGKRVLYEAYPGTGGAESGVIVSVGEVFVFVRYGDDTGTKATSAVDLELE